MVTWPDFDFKGFVLTKIPCQVKVLVDPKQTVGVSGSRQNEVLLGVSIIKIEVENRVEKLVKSSCVSTTDPDLIADMRCMTSAH